MPAVVTLGETMVLATPAQPGRLRHAPQLDLRIGGAESNVAIALARLDIAAGWVSWLGQDELGELVLSRIRAEGVDTSQVRRMPQPTGLYLRERLATGVQVYYYRTGSAAAQMGPDAFDPAYLDGATVLHLSGITPALSASCAELALWAARQARQREVLVSFDVNYRSKLWAPASARAACETIMPLVDLLLVGDEEAEALWGRSDDDLLFHLAAHGPRNVVLKRGAAGCTALIDGTLHTQPAFAVTAVDPIGAGDAFAAGYLAAWLEQAPPIERLRWANALGAYSVMSLGDYEGLPSRVELDLFMRGQRTLGR